MRANKVGKRARNHIDTARKIEAII